MRKRFSPAPYRLDGPSIWSSDQKGIVAYIHGLDHPNPEFREEAKYTGLLFAAAPELLDACDEADTALAVINLTCELTPQARAALRDAWAAVNAAIAAATGTHDLFLVNNPDYKRGKK
jgi:hypothetical protein